MSIWVMIFALALVGLGVVLLIFPERFRNINLRMRGTRIRPMPRLSPRQEVWSIRVSGAGAILVGVFIGLMLWINR